MSERKDRGRLILSQPKTFSSIYQSRIITSYPPCPTPRTLITPKKNDPSQRQCLIASKRNNQWDNMGQYQRTTSEQKRPRSLDFKNNLFLKLANKIQKQKEIEHNRNEEVLNEYYDSGINKQNESKSNNQLVKVINPLKSSIHLGKQNPVKTSRYEKAEPMLKESKQKIKFNKLKPSLTKKKPEEDTDFVRTSDGDFRITKSSLDMRPIM